MTIPRRQFDTTSALIFFACALFSLTVNASPVSETPRTYIADLIKKASDLKLENDLQWLNLVHYKKTLLRGYESQVDGTAFFLSPDGKRDPRAEMAATISGFFSTKIYSEDEQHPQCQFPARLLWLEKKLGLDRSKLPAIKCERFEQFKRRHDTKSASLIFSSYYLNNPSSAFGHSFLRLNKTPHSIGAKNEERFELLDNGVNYAADVTTSNPVLYAIYGLLGFFKGTYTSVPYYYKVREYNDYESRDLWSYDLDLTSDEVEMLVRHIWELGSTYIDYFYFSENCSYHMLSTIEAAAPRFVLTDKLPFYVIPAETMKAVAAEPDLVRKITFRPSARSMFRYRISRLSGAEQAVLKNIVGSKDYGSAIATQTRDLSNEARVRVLDAALDYMEFKHPEDLLKSETESAKNKQKLLSTRAHIPIQSDDAVIVPPLEDQPHRGHGARRFTLSGGYQRSRVGDLGDGAQATNYINAGFRFALHDLLDPIDGYPPGSQIEFMNLNGRYHRHPAQFALDEATIFRVTSLSPINSFEKSLSWRVTLGAKRFYDRNCDHCLGGGFEVGFGGATDLGDSSIVFLLNDMEGSMSPGFATSKVRVALGPQAGVLTHFSRSISTLLGGGYRYLFFSEEPHSYFGNADLRFRFADSFVWNAQWRLTSTMWEAESGVLFYF